MIQRPPACERHAAELPGRQRIVEARECPWCWQEDKVVHHMDGDPRNNDPANLEIHSPECIANGYGKDYGCTC